MNWRRQTRCYSNRRFRLDLGLLRLLFSAQQRRNGGELFLTTLIANSAQPQTGVWNLFCHTNKQVTLAQLRAGGKCPILRAYLHDIGAADSTTCTSCDEEVNYVEHVLLRCPAYIRKRMLHLASNPELAVLARDPLGAVAFLVEIGRIQTRRRKPRNKQTNTNTPGAPRTHIFCAITQGRF